MIIRLKSKLKEFFKLIKGKWAVIIGISLGILILLVFISLITGWTEPRPLHKGGTPSNPEIICAENVVFSIMGVCKSGNDYKILISNDGKPDITGWKVKLYQTVEKVDLIKSDERVQGLDLAYITVTPKTITEVRKIEVIPLIRIVEQDFICSYNIDSYGDIGGNIITAECNE